MVRPLSSEARRRRSPISCGARNASATRRERTAAYARQPRPESLTSWGSFARGGRTAANSLHAHLWPPSRPTPREEPAPRAAHEQNAIVQYCGAGRSVGAASLAPAERSREPARVHLAGQRRRTSGRSCTDTCANSGAGVERGMPRGRSARPTFAREPNCSRGSSRTRECGRAEAWRRWRALADSPDGGAGPHAERVGGEVTRARAQSRARAARRRSWPTGVADRRFQDQRARGRQLARVRRLGRLRDMRAARALSRAVPASTAAHADWCTFVLGEMRSWPPALQDPVRLVSAAFDIAPTSDLSPSRALGSAERAR